MTLLLDTLTQDGVALRRDGRWQAGSCPWCGGRDRFVVKPTGIAWFCRGGCSGGRYQDVVAYVQRRDSVTYGAACRVLGLDPGNAYGDHEAEGPVAVERERPPAAWTDRALEFLDMAERDLEGKPRAWLNSRGLKDETLARFRIGFSPGGPPIFGFGWQTRCITIPWLLSGGGGLWGVRCRFPEGGRKYAWLPGSVPTIFDTGAATNRRVGFLTEGEFDAMLLAQEAGHLAGVATLGSASATLHGQATLRLLGLQRIFVCLDSDPAGQAGARRLLATSRRMTAVPVPAGKDITDAWRAGINLRQWVQDVLGAHGVSTTPQPSPTHSDLPAEAHALCGCG